MYKETFFSVRKVIKTSVMMPIITSYCVVVWNQYAVIKSSFELDIMFGNIAPGEEGNKPIGIQEGN